MSDVLRHYFPKPLFVLIGVEALLLFACAYLGSWIVLGTFPNVTAFLPSALAFTSVMVLAMMATDVHGARLREGLPGMAMRTAIGFFVVGIVSLAVIFYALPSLGMGRSSLLIATGAGFVAIAILRWFAFPMLSESTLKKRVLVYGTGERALRIATRMRRAYDQRGFELHGYVLVEGTPDLVSGQGASVCQPSVALLEYCAVHDVEEIVMALDSHPGDEQTKVDPRLDELLACRMGGISVLDALEFVEREAGRIDLQLLGPDWVVSSRGLDPRPLGAVGKRIFDVLASALLLVLASPLFVIGLFMAALTHGFRGPLFSRQTCVGLGGQTFERLSLNTARPSEDAARPGLVRGLPQLVNVLTGSMSLVGRQPAPRDYWDRVSDALPFSEEREHLRPGIFGWAQLNCAADTAYDAVGQDMAKDAEEILQYDLYYLKNHAILLDLAIMLQAAQIWTFRRV